MTNDDKIVSLTATLDAQETADREYQAKLDRIAVAQRALAEAIKTLRDAGMDSKDIVRLLRQGGGRH
jgi:hypothetical protein